MMYSWSGLRRIFRFRDDIKLAFSLMKDPEVPLRFKLPVFAALIYFIAPLDLFSDYVLPGIGYLDDLVILLWAVQYLIHRCPIEIKQRYIRYG